ncbi:MAG: ribonuclease Y [Verrucomicrobia bacterium]|nr:ribonuclease Y [Verrucomicrobiota bacterium]
MTFLAHMYVEGLAEGLLGMLVGVMLGYWLFRWREQGWRKALAEREEAVLNAARLKADGLLQEARLAAQEEARKLTEQTEHSFAGRQRELEDLNRRLVQRESLINQQLEGLIQQEKNLRAAQTALQTREAKLENERAAVAALDRQRREELLALAHLSEEEARACCLKEVEREGLRDAIELTRHILDQAKGRAEDQARRIISTAIQRYAGEHTFETTTSTLALPNEEIKGRIIGREGRNIRAFEAITGVTVLIDDTPNAVVLSAFDPVRREIAREAMHRLILDGRIHPTRIEEIVTKVNQEIDEAILKAGEEAVVRAGLPPLHLEIVKLLGRLRFRHSFAQNILDHSVEVAHLTGIMAAELGLNVSIAKRAGLLHDIGKALDHEVEGTHALIGAEFVKRYGESEEVVNGVASHHDEVPPAAPYGILVGAADAISASRPGARSETTTTYLKRLENLEKIGRSFAGVDKCFAVQAGRELRVMVHPDQVSDEQAFTLARNLVRKIEDELQYPGQIRITVIRESRTVEFAK